MTIKLIIRSQLYRSSHIFIYIIIQLIQYNRKSFFELIVDTMTNAYRFISSGEINVRERAARLDKTCRLRVRNQQFTNSTSDSPRKRSRDIHTSNAAYYLSVDDNNTITLTPLLFRFDSTFLMFSLKSNLVQRFVPLRTVHKM